MSDFKICHDCNEKQPINKFDVKPTGKNGHSNFCRKCTEHKRRTRREYDPEERKREALRDTFGITLEEFKQKLLQQNGVCAICGKPETSMFRGKLRHLAVDHNHTTKQIRGLLCNKCNIALGWFQEDICSLESAIKYLKFWHNVS